MHSSFAFTLVMALSISASLANASPKEDSDRHFGEGLRLYVEKDYKAAAAEFALAYKAQSKQQTLFAWAQSERQQGNCGRSRELLSKYIAKGTSAKQSKAAFQLMEDCKQRPVTNDELPKKNIEKLRNATKVSGLAGSSGASSSGASSSGASSSGASSSGAPSSGASSSGASSSGASMSSGTANSTVSEPSADSGNAAVTSLGLGSSVSSSASAKPWYRNWMGLSLLSLGGVSVIFGGINLLSATDVEEDATLVGTSYDDYRHLAAEARDYREGGVVFLLAGTALVTGGIVYILSEDSPKKTEGLALQVRGGGASVSLSGSF